MLLPYLNSIQFLYGTFRQIFIVILKTYHIFKIMKSEVSRVLSLSPQMPIFHYINDHRNSLSRLVFSFFFFLLIFVVPDTVP